MPGLLKDMLVWLRWRLNLYWSSELLAPAHVFDPRVGLEGLKYVKEVGFNSWMK